MATATTVSTNTSMYRSMAQYHLGLVVIIAHLTNAKTAVCQLTCASDAAGTGKSNVSGKTVTLTGTTAAPEQVGSIEFNAMDLRLTGATLIFAGVDITTNQNGDDVGAVLIRSAARYYEGSSLDA